MAMNRRKFLKRLAASAGACCASTLTSGLSFTLCPAASAAGGGKIIVALYMNGGADTLDWLYPNIGVLNDRRPTLKDDILASELAVPGHANLLWNPMLTDFSTEYNAGNLAPILAVAPNNHSGSHEVAREYWNFGRSSGNGAGEPTTGWFARVLNELGADNAFACFNLASLSLTQGTTAAVNGSLGSFGWDQSGGDAEKARNTLFALSAQTSSDSEQAQALLRSYQTAEGAVLRVRAAIEDTTFTNAYPSTGIGNQFRDAERVIANFPETCAITINDGGHDTHGNQRATNNGNHAQIGGAIATFLANMRARGISDKVTVFVYSEFGRQITENATQGTDHGRAGTCFVFGDSVNGGIYGPDYTANSFNGKDRLDAEVNLVHVLGPMAEWLGANPNNIFENYSGASALTLF